MANRMIASGQHLVRIGAMGHIGRFKAVDAREYPRGCRVICRTGRGLEVGEVLTTGDLPTGDLEKGDSTPDGSHGSLLRAMTVEDELLLARIEKHRDKAYDACCKMLQERGLDVTLMDVEQLFDGGSLIFYFLGETTPQVEALTESLAELYETKVQFRKFAEAVTQGCGPGCGTEDAVGGGCSTGGCSSCVVAGACGSSVTK